MDIFTPGINISLWLDVCLLIAVIGIFALWLRNARRQKNLESMLVDTARQLAEATAHLDAATRMLAKVKKDPAPQPNSNQTVNARASAKASPATGKTKHRHTPVSVAQRAYQPDIATDSRHTSENTSIKASTQTSMILRMQREGESPERIADKLDMPLAQVRLLLKLQAAASHA